MQCFEHYDRAAVGLCRHCGRALCRDCATVAVGCLSCRGDCEAKVIREQELIHQTELAMKDRSQVFAIASGTYHRAFAGSTIAGLVLMAGAAMLCAGGAPPVAWAFLGGFGMVCLITGMGHARASRAYRRLESSKDNNSANHEHSD